MLAGQGWNQAPYDVQVGKALPVDPRDQRVPSYSQSCPYDYVHSCQSVSLYYHNFLSEKGEQITK